MRVLLLCVLCGVGLARDAKLQNLLNDLESDLKDFEETNGPHGPHFTPTKVAPLSGDTEPASAEAALQQVLDELCRCEVPSVLSHLHNGSHSDAPLRFVGCGDGTAQCGYSGDSVSKKTGRVLGRMGHAAYFAYLIVTSVPAQTLPGNNNSPDVCQAVSNPYTHPEEAFPRLLRLLWLGSQYGYNPENHYKPLLEDGKRGRAEKHKVEYHAVTCSVLDDACPADAAFAIIHPTMLSFPPGMHPSRWFCQQFYHDMCPPQVSGQYMHVTFRGMQLSFNMKVPPVEDLVNMKGLTNLVKCKFLRTAAQMGFGAEVPSFVVVLEITDGVCKMLTSLVYRENILELVTEHISKLVLRSPEHRPFVLFQGLSFGGAVAQAFSVLYQLYARFISKHRTFLYNRVTSAGDGASILFATAVFGAPRVGGVLFRDQFEDLQIRMHHFAMYSYQETTDTVTDVRGDHPITLKYDPIAFWPEELTPVGTMFSLVYFKNRDDSVYARIHRDLDEDAHVCGTRSRFVPASDTTAFKCLHLFPHYRSFFERTESDGWCHKGHVGPSYYVAEFEV
eukprot:c9632_g1_i1.p1 GENE.c9632_g1_i1~~c9632_g1_i1.p1  ORF type:complete len:569 (+),score=142.66 c9632_g1_i1:30-1709(+)